MNRFAPAALVLAALAALPAAPPARAAGATPTIATVDPSVGLTAGGTTVTITGTDFAVPMEVTFGGAQATSVVVVSPTQLTCVTPPHARGPVDVVVTQATPPPTASAPAVGAFAYEEFHCHAWVPRAPGSATGGNPGGTDVTVVDYANRRVVASLDLNAADPDLPTDDDWRVTQVLFDSSGDTAFLASAGTPGTLDSGKIWIVRTARVLGAEEGEPVLSVLSTAGNPYQIALSSDGNTLYAADAGSWESSSTVFPNGTFGKWNVTDRANPAAVGSPRTVGVLPVLSWDLASYQGWGTNSSFRGVIQSKNGTCVVTNAGSHTLSLVQLATLTLDDTVDVGASTAGLLQVTTSIPSPYSDDFLFVQTTDLLADATEYFIYRISTGILLEKGSVGVPMRFFSVLPSPDLQNRTAWPHPDGQSMVALPEEDASVAAWNPATGGAGSRTAVQGGGPPSTLAYNDATGFFYAREADGGWTVFTVPATRGAAPVEAAKVTDAAGVDSLRVVGDGSWILGTASSSLAVIDGRETSADLHKVVETIALSLDPAGGPLFPQPGAACGAARTFVVNPGPGAGPQVVLPLQGTEFCAGEDPPEFEATLPSGQGRFELEIGTQYDFLLVPGAARFRVPIPEDADTARPPRRAWRRVLRVAAGEMARPFYARVNAVYGDGTRLYGTTVSYRVCAAEPPVSVAPDDDVAGSADDPPEFVFEPGGAERAWVEFTGVLGFGPGTIGRFRVPVEAGAPEASGRPPRALWREAVRRAVRQYENNRSAAANFTYPVVGWRVRGVDALGRVVRSETRSIGIF